MHRPLVGFMQSSAVVAAGDEFHGDKEEVVSDLEHVDVGTAKFCVHLCGDGTKYLNRAWECWQPYVAHPDCATP